MMGDETHVKRTFLANITPLCAEASALQLNKQETLYHWWEFATRKPLVLFENFLHEDNQEWCTFFVRSRRFELKNPATH